MELMTGFEPVTSSLPRKCSTPELHEHLSDATSSEVLAESHSPDGQKTL